MTTLISVITVALSGFIGALAGGAMSLMGQYYARKWQKEDSEREYKKQLYAELSGVGSHYLGGENFQKVNSLVAKTLLIAGQDLQYKVVEYAASIEKINNEIAGKGQKELDELLEKNAQENGTLHREMLRLMRRELGIAK